MYTTLQGSKMNRIQRRPGIGLGLFVALVVGPAALAGCLDGGTQAAGADMAMVGPGPGPDLAMRPPPGADLAMSMMPPGDMAMSMPPGDAGACTGPNTTTAGVECAYTYNALNPSASVNKNSTVAWSCNATNRLVTGNGIPDHAVGTFPNPNCPNTITAQAVNASMTLKPTLAANVTNPGPGGIGYARNGVKFDPATAGTCTVANGQTTCSLIGNTGAWNIEALGQKSFNFGVDNSNAHVQPNGAYHYHGMPTGVIDGLGKGMAMTLVGFANDGFPIYARYGYSKANDAGSGLKVLTASYRLKAQPDQGRPSVNTYPMGTFTQDWEYAAGSGDLDQCNGRTGVTPEFPCGIYHYVITETWPFIGRCLKGTVAGGMQPMPDGGMPAQDAGGMTGPKPCTMNSDCVNACGAMAKGCVCGQTPMGMGCIPTCTVNADCPPGPMGMMLSCRNGTCQP